MEVHDMFASWHHVLSQLFNWTLAAISVSWSIVCQFDPPQWASFVLRENVCLQCLFYHFSWSLVLYAVICTQWWHHDSTNVMAAHCLLCLAPMHAFQKLWSCLLGIGVLLAYFKPGLCAHGINYKYSSVMKQLLFIVSVLKHASQ